MLDSLDEVDGVAMMGFAATFSRREKLSRRIVWALADRPVLSVVEL